MFSIITHSAAATAAVAETLGSVLPSDTLLILNGALGAGKTAFAQGLAKGLGIRERVTSPTFMLAQEYEEGRLPFAHLDAYRLEGSDIFDLGLEEYWQQGGVCLIEWGLLLEPILPACYTRLDIAVLDENSRRLDFSGEHEELIRQTLTDKEEII